MLKNFQKSYSHRAYLSYRMYKYGSKIRGQFIRSQQIEINPSFCDHFSIHVAMRKFKMADNNECYIS